MPTRELWRWTRTVKYVLCPVVNFGSSVPNDSTLLYSVVKQELGNGSLKICGQFRGIKTMMLEIILYCIL